MTHHKDRTPIDVRQSNCINQIKERYKENELAIVELSEIRPLLNNEKFIDLIIDEEIPFVSEVDKELSKSISKMMLYLANKKGYKNRGNKLFGEITSKRADKFALKMKPIIADLDNQGYKTLQSKVDKLNADNIKTARGKTWHVASITRILKRLEKLDLEKDKVISRVLKPK